MSLDVLNKEAGLTFELLLKIVKRMNTAMIVSDTKGKFLLWNDAADQLFDREISRGSEYKSDYELSTLDGRRLEPTYTPLGRALKGETVSHEKYYIKGGKQKNGIYIEFSAMPIYDDNGCIEAAVVTLCDITKEEEIWKDITQYVREMKTFIKEKVGFDYDAVQKKYFLRSALNT